MAVGVEGPPLPPNRITPFPLSPALSIISEVASKSKVLAFIENAPPLCLIKLLASCWKLNSPLPLKNIPAASNAGEVPSFIVPPLSVLISSVVVSIFKSSVTISIVLEPSKVILFELAFPTLNSPLLFINTPSPVVLLADEAFDVSLLSKTILVLLINNVVPPFKVKSSEVISNPAVVLRIKLSAFL